MTFATLTGRLCSTLGMRVRSADVSRPFRLYEDPGADVARIARLEREVVRLRADLERVISGVVASEAPAAAGAPPAAVPSGAVIRSGARRRTTSVPVPLTARPLLSRAG